MFKIWKSVICLTNMQLILLLWGRLLAQYSTLFKTIMTCMKANLGFTFLSFMFVIYLANAGMYRLTRNAYSMKLKISSVSEVKSFHLCILHCEATSGCHHCVHEIHTETCTLMYGVSEVAIASIDRHGSILIQNLEGIVSGMRSLHGNGQN